MTFSVEHHSFFLKAARLPMPPTTFTKIWSEASNMWGLSGKFEGQNVGRDHELHDGDFIESQAFAYLAIRSYLKKYISIPSTTGVKKKCLGGKFFKF